MAIKIQAAVCSASCFLYRNSERYWVRQTYRKEPYVNPRGRVLLQVIIRQLVKKITACYLTWRPVTLLQQLSTCPCFDSDGSSPRPYPISFKSLLMLSSPVLLGLPGSLFPSCFLSKIICAFFFSSICHMPYPFHFPRFHRPNNVGCGVPSPEAYCRVFLQLPVTSI